MFGPVLDRELTIITTVGTVYAVVYLQMFKLTFISKYVTLYKRKWKIAAELGRYGKTDQLKIKLLF